MTNGSNGHQATILFVDDNIALLRSVERLLLMEGFEVLLAADGEEALQQMATAAHLPDMVISDVAMPRMDGFELFHAIRERDEWLHIPFLFLTARDQLDDLRRGYSLGVDDYLVKPLDQDRLLMIIDNKLKLQEVKLRWRREQLERLRREREALEAAKRELAMLVAHELRTPLGSITMVSDILAHEFDTMQIAQIQEMLDLMKNGSVRLSRLIEQMVMYVQLQSGALTDAIQGRVRMVPLAELVQSAIQRTRQFGLNRGTSVVSYQASGSFALVEGDTDALRHALAELIANACVFSQPGDAVIVSDVVEGDIASVTISDQGCGIPQDALQHVFEPYYQFNRRRFEQQGIGLGLTLACGIAQIHGGSVNLESVENYGTRAVFTLPVQKEE